MLKFIHTISSHLYLF